MCPQVPAPSARFDEAKAARLGTRLANRYVETNPKMDDIIA